MLRLASSTVATGKIVSELCKLYLKLKKALENKLYKQLSDSTSCSVLETSILWRSGETSIAVGNRDSKHIVWATPQKTKPFRTATTDHQYTTDLCHRRHLIIIEELLVRLYVMIIGAFQKSAAAANRTISKYWFTAK